MAVTAKVYGPFVDHLAEKLIDLDTDTFKIVLTTSAYTPDQDAHDLLADITNEVVGTGYTAGGATLGSVTWGYTSGTNVWKFDAADASWASSTITARYAVIYDDTAAGDPLVCYIDFGADVISTGGTFLITFHANGIVTATVA